MNDHKKPDPVPAPCANGSGQPLPEPADPVAELEEHAARVHRLDALRSTLEMAFEELAAWAGAGCGVDAADVTDADVALLDDLIIRADEIAMRAGGRAAIRAAVRPEFQTTRS